MTEARTITVAAYRDADGHPTCCTNWETARCQFIFVRKFGLIEVCGATGSDIGRGPHDLRRGEIVTSPEDHPLRPVPGCPVWAVNGGRRP